MVHQSSISLFIALIVVNGMLFMVFRDFVAQYLQAVNQNLFISPDYGTRLDDGNESQGVKNTSSGSCELHEMLKDVNYLNTELLRANERLQKRLEEIIAAYKRKQENFTKYIASDYFAVHAGGGVGNVLFEFISLIGIAKSLGR
ncbi:unnamed protein product [Toxocara canis]|uniref:Rod shape-determining protein MreC n=1 Tax=Toxocara canis TaxID=6265 RepID=A0A183V8M7_TOXCA|nr:unnamed protein product [Toxocara canis]